MVRTLTRYLARRFLLTVLAVFGSIFMLIFVIDFVEMMRRTSDLPRSTTLQLAAISLMRTPSIAEKVLPFVMLIAAMMALINLTRRLELVVARAAGVSVWQFLLPLAFAGLLIGVFATTVYNPVSAQLKLRADRMETKLGARSLRTTADEGIWLRQRSVDGQSVLRAEIASDGGTSLSGVTAFVYDPEGRFVERIEAARGFLTAGSWQLTDARISSLEGKPQQVASYNLATNLTPEQVTQAFAAPDTVPFWRLLPLVARSEAAGIDATRYRLRFQELIARPLLLMAMVFIAASFSLRFFRFGGVARMVSGGVISGFVLYVATKLASDLGGAGLLSAPVAAWSPAIVGSMLGVLVLLHLEDG